ncbi:transcription elongation factor GreA [Armatimonas sp.]|uniref:transcription elongation factor GreA n=1 Tax=Armatimonas sp. TaxID=1872638 RepID=UPI003752AA9D
MSEDIVLTPSGKKKIETELDRLRSVDMPALAIRIREARDLGDLSENFDYQDAKRQQGFIGGRIADLQAMLERAIIVPEGVPGSDTVGMGSKVTVRDTEFDDEFTYTLVGSYEADPVNDLISVASPVGAALMGKKVGASVTVSTPGGTMTLEILTLE